MPEDITQASPDVAVNVSNDHPSPLIPEAQVPNQKCLTIIKIPRSRFSELIEPLSFESDSATDNKGTSSLPPRKPDSDDHGPTTCYLLANKWQIILSFAGILFLISTITISPLKHHLILGHHLWKFAALLLSVFCSLLISDRLVRLAYLAVPRTNYVLYRMRNPIRTYFWIALFAFTWSFCFDKSMSSIDVHKVVDSIYRAVPAVFIAFVIWQVKTIMFEMFRAAFYVKRFYKRLMGAAIDLYMLDALMDCEFGEHKQTVASSKKCIMKKVNEMMEVALNTSGMPRHVADRLLLEHIEGFKKSGFKADDQSKILKAAREAFKRMAGENGYIRIEDMEKLLTKEEVDIAFPLMEDAYDVGKIRESSFLEWMMIVEEINIMTTVFLQFDHEKIYYPNSELSKKPISNCSRSPHMGEKIEFSIGISTPEISVTKLRERIEQYLVSKSDYWQPKHSLFMTGIEDSKMKIDLNVLHRKNYKNFHEMNKRKSELLFELNTIFQELGIKNYAIPKETTSVKNEKDDISKETTPSLPKHHG